MKISVRKEIVKCSICHEPNTFLYLSDFSYAERLALYDHGKKYAYINLLVDKIYDEFLELLAQIQEKVDDKPKVQVFDNNLFSVACDEIQETRVEFDCNRKCTKCGSDHFEDVLTEPETVETEELPVITHEKWTRMSSDEKKKRIYNFILKDI